MRFISTALRSLGTDPVWSFLVGMAVILAFIGPFGTFEALTLPLRFAYWAPVVIGANVFVRLSHRLVDHITPNPTNFQWHTLNIFVFSASFSPAIWGYSALFEDGFRSLDSFLFILANVFGVTASVGYLVFFMTRKEVDPEPADVSLPRLYARLPQTTTAPIERLTVDDHYVEVFLDDGASHRLLMRLSDAVREMDDTPGFYTHRSHWVAAAHVRQSTREKNRDYLMLATGAKVPVSRTYRDDIQTAGFL